MSTRTILVWQLCCEADNHTSDAPKKDTRLREIWRTELKRRPLPGLRCLQHLHELTLNICDCRCLDETNVERKACSGFRSRRQQSLHGRQLLPQLSLLNDRENAAGQANRLSIS